MVRTRGYRVDVYRNGARYKELKCIGPPRIDANSEASIKMSMTGTFLYDEDVDYLNDQLKAYVIIDGVESAIGLFEIAAKEDSYTEYRTHQIQLECYDQCYILSGTRTENILHLSAGTNYLTAVQQLLTTAGIILYISTPTSATLTTDREDWEVGTDYLTIINQLLNEINYENIWFNAEGFAVLEPVQPLSAIFIDHQYNSNDNLSILQTSLTATTDLYDKPNVFIVICSNPDLEVPMTAVAVNDSPLSDLSVFKRGRRISQVYKVDNIANQAALDDYAQRLCNNSIFQSEVVTIETAITTGHGINDIVAIDHPLISGIFKETAWSMSLGIDGSMSHTLQRVIMV